MTLSPGLRPRDDRVGIADGLAEDDGDLMGDVSVALGRGDEDEGLAADAGDGEDGDDGRGSWCSR